MNSGIIDSTPPVERALTGVRDAMVELINAVRDGGLDHHDEPGLLRLLDGAERIRNQFQAFDADLLAACVDRRVAERECMRSMAKVLEHRCRLSPHEANRRMKAADAAGQRVSMAGVPLPRLRPHVADAMVTGGITAEQTAQIREALEKIERSGVHPDQVETIESELIKHATVFGPPELKRLCRRYREAYDPDGTEPDEQRNRDRRHFRFGTTPSGAVAGEFRLTPETGAKLKAVLGALANPRVDTAGGSKTADLRSHEQRQHDALDEALSRLLRSDGLPASGGTPATVIVTIDLPDLLAHTGRLTGLDWQSWITTPCPKCGSARDLPAEAATAEPAAQRGPDLTDDRLTDPPQSASSQVIRTGSDSNRMPPASSGKGPGADQDEPDNPIKITDMAQDVSSDSIKTTEPDQIGPGVPIKVTDLGPPGRVRRSRPRCGITSDGTVLSVPELLRLAGEAEIYPVVLTQHGILLDLGRSRRIANQNQTIALIARDGGCSFPGCDHPPEFCERHHVVSWLDNGKTEVKNLTLLCPYHHHNFLDQGWQVKINADGLPEWIPPRYIDPEQKSMINNRITARIHQATLV